MNEPSNDYEIRVGGHLGDTLLGAFPELAAAVDGSDTVLTGRLRDPAAVYGIIARLESLGLERSHLYRKMKTLGISIRESLS